MTIYRLYSHNGDRAGFWVQHRSWANTCVQVQTIAGQTRGKLPGDAPLHDHAEVLIRSFDVRSGRPMQLGPQLQNPEDQKYTLIAKPWWFHGDEKEVSPNIAQ